MEFREEAPDLSGEVKILSYRPVFHGSYSSVYRGKLESDGQLVLHTLPEITLSTIQRKLKRERGIWSILRHQNILPLYGFANDLDLFQPLGALISPWLELGDLARYMRDQAHLAPLSERLLLWKEVVNGVEYLHLHDPLLVHGDLKPRNVLIDDAGNARICDFGLIRVCLEGGNSGMTTTTAHAGTEPYLAYELFMAEPEDAIPTTASDIYATGCIGLKVLFLGSPYYSHGANLRRYMMREMQERRPPAIRPNHLTSHLTRLWDLVSGCWLWDPPSRPNASVLSTRLQDALAGLIFTAAREGDTNTLGLLLPVGDVNLRDDVGCTPLHVVAEEGNEEAVRIMLRLNEVDVNAKDTRSRQTPLSMAAAKGHDAVIRVLLKCKRVDVNLVDDVKQTPLLWAARNGHTAVVQALLQHKRIEPNLVDNDGRTPLLWASKGKSEEAVMVLLGHVGVDANLADNSGRTPLSWAAEKGQGVMVYPLLKREEVNPNFADNTGRTPLSWAAEKGHDHVVKALFTREELNPNNADHFAQTPLSWAARNNHGGVMRMLLTHKYTNANRQDNDGQTPLLWAARNGRITAVHALLQYRGTEPNLADYFGRTPLSWAAGNGHYTVVRMLLLGRGVDVNRKDNVGRTPIWWADRNKHDRVVLLLRQDSTSTHSEY